jgi:hypothetical protein
MYFYGTYYMTWAVSSLSAAQIQICSELVHTAAVLDHVADGIYQFPVN